MKVIAAYLLAVLGGNTTLCVDNVKDILASVGDEADDEKIDLLLSQVKSKDITELITCGWEKLASIPAGGSAVVAESKNEEKVEEKEESGDDMGFSFFD
ncbi:60S acidic ribosomal protein p2b [Phtheirospermum japonicum]|uniref:60S acidic ribosomal protein p2b n=1 Tax=Phtheirospermum japonicum TaxID=374723 RepID=A0A830C7C0_9LAMI|nr:60S acidic ribosomal protein p2b [Phtheirospermum japonicum]